MRIATGSGFPRSQSHRTHQVFSDFCEQNCVDLCEKSQSHRTHQVFSDVRSISSRTRAKKVAIPPHASGLLRPPRVRPRTPTTTSSSRRNPTARIRSSPTSSLANVIDGKKESQSHRTHQVFSDAGMGFVMMSGYKKVAIPPHASGLLRLEACREFGNHLLMSQSHRTHQVFSDCWVSNLLSLNKLKAARPLPGKLRSKTLRPGSGFNLAWKMELTERK
jgi:hypothetical protein